MSPGGLETASNDIKETRKVYAFRGEYKASCEPDATAKGEP